MGSLFFKTVSKRILEIIRESDTACRIGGDEFIVLLPSVSQKNDVEKICQRLISTISREIPFNDTELTVQVSVGAAFYPDNARDPAELKKMADIAMYEVKQSGKNSYLFTKN